MQIQPKDDLYHYACKDGVHYALAAHKSTHLLLFAEYKEDMTKLQMKGHRIWVDPSGKGRYQSTDENLASKLVPAEFVRAKYIQAIYFFNRLEDVQNKIESKKEAADKDALTLEIDSCFIRLVKSLIRDITNIKHIDKIIKNEIDLAIQNNIDNEMYVPEGVKRSNVMKKNEWSSLIVANNNYCFNEAELRKGDDKMLFYLAIHKTDNYLIFARDLNSKFNTTAIYHLYINPDNGLGMYKVQTKDSNISNQFFVPDDYVVDRCNRFREFMDGFEKLQNATDAYTRQTIWHVLQDNVIHLINYSQRELEGDLKQEINKSLDHCNIILTYYWPDIKSFEDFYTKVVEIEKKMRLEVREDTYVSRLILFGLHNQTVSIIPITKFKNDVFLPDEKVRILISKFGADYYVLVMEGWMPKNHEIQKRVAENFRNGNVTRLPSDERTEVLTFIGKTKRSTNRESDKSEVYEIIREKQNDEDSRILELRKLEIELNYGMERLLLL